jgi:hypothetical protein
VDVVAVVVAVVVVVVLKGTQSLFISPFLAQYMQVGGIHKFLHSQVQLFGPF